MKNHKIVLFLPLLLLCSVGCSFKYPHTPERLVRSGIISVTQDDDLYGVQFRLYEMKVTGKSASALVFKSKAQESVAKTTLSSPLLLVEPNAWVQSASGDVADEQQYSYQILLDNEMRRFSQNIGMYFEVKVVPEAIGKQVRVVGVVSIQGKDHGNENLFMPFDVKVTLDKTTQIFNISRKVSK